MIRKNKNYDLKYIIKLLHQIYSILRINFAREIQYYSYLKKAEFQHIFKRY